MTPKTIESRGGKGEPNFFEGVDDMVERISSPAAAEGIEMAKESLVRGQRNVVTLVPHQRLPENEF